MYLKGVSFVIFACITVVVLDIGQLIVSYGARLDAARISTENLATSLAHYSRDVFKTTDTQIKILIDNYTRLDHLETFEIAHLERRLRIAVKNDDFIDLLLLFDAHGDWLASSLDAAHFERLRSVNIADRAYFQYHATHPNDELVISLINRRTDGQWAIALSRRMNTADGSFAGIGGAGIKPELFRTFFQTLNVGKHGYIILKNKSDILAQIGSIFEVPYIESIRNVPGFDLSVIVALDKTETLQAWWNSAYINLSGLIAILSLMSLLGYRLIVQIRIRNAAEAGLFEATQLLEQRVIDRTAALRAAVVQRDNLLREVFHRVKNNMQVVDGLLYLKIKDSLEATSLHDMRLLIHAINLAHDYLMETRDFGTFDIAPFLINLVQDVGSQWSDEVVDITVSPMRVDVDYAVPIGLLLTELISVCFKAGGNRIALSLSLHNETISICCDQYATGVDSKLMKSLLRQLNGVLKMNESGVKITFMNRVAFR